MQIIPAIFVVTALAATASAGPAIAIDDNFHTVNDMGGYHFGYNDGRLARQEERTPEGIVRGAYTYVDANGQVQIVKYTADKYNGFLVSGSNIPKIGRIPEDEEFGEIREKAPAAIVADTPEVASARAEHLEAVRRAMLGEINSLPVITEELPLPVQYTPEVAAARAEHLLAYNQEALRSRSVFASPPSVPYVAPAAQFHPDYLPYAAL